MNLRFTHRMRFGPGLNKGSGRKSEKGGSFSFSFLPALAWLSAAMEYIIIPAGKMWKRRSELRRTIRRYKAQETRYKAQETRYKGIILKISRIRTGLTKRIKQIFSLWRLHQIEN